MTDGIRAALGMDEKNRGNRDDRPHTFCPQCGWSVKVDEDLCCVECGATAAGQAIDELYEVLEQLADDKGNAYWTSEEVQKIARNTLK